MISFIVAMGKNRVIGKQNRMPWHISEDLRYFKKTTMGHSIIMGRKTFESMGGKPMDGRNNIILTRDPGYKAENCTILTSIDQIKAGSNEEIFIIGGSEIFKQTLQMVDKMYITEINSDFDGDAFFPQYNTDEWQLVSKNKGLNPNSLPYDYSFCIYQKIK